MQFWKQPRAVRGEFDMVFLGFFGIFVRCSMGFPLVSLILEGFLQSFFPWKKNLVFYIGGVFWLF